MNLVHAVASCTECDFSCEDYKFAGQKARDHAKRTGHRVTAEYGYSATYGGTPEKIVPRRAPDGGGR